MEPNKPIFIAEIKTKSPFGFQSPHSFYKLMECALEHGDWISVHTNALWGGDYEAVSFVRRNTGKPILAKGLHTTNDDIMRSFDHGANYVLVVNRFPQKHSEINPDKLLLEINDLFVIKDYLPSWSSGMFVCNSRDLKTGLVKKTNELDAYLKLGVWTCQASNIATPNDVNPNVNAFIVGTNLIEYCIARNYE